MYNKDEEEEDVSSYWTAMRKRICTLKEEALDLGGDRLWAGRKTDCGMD
jgi:hypothetical protein